MSGKWWAIFDQIIVLNFLIRIATLRIFDANIFEEKQG